MDNKDIYGDRCKITPPRPAAIHFGYVCRLKGDSRKCGWGEPLEELAQFPHRLSVYECH
ncbi:hypothetical protein BG005_000414, partial [Podila minutissima]